MASSKDAVVLELDGHEVRVSNPEKPYFGDKGIRKIDVVEYFVAVGPGILFALRILLAFFSAGGIMNEVTPGLILNTVFFFALITLAAIALVGELVIRNFLTLQHCPAYVVRERHSRDTEASPANGSD